MLRNESGHKRILTMFGHQYTEEKDFPDNIASAFTVDIDDCDCISCEESRGLLQKYSTISICIHTKKGIYSQRLTPEEAKDLAKTLNIYAKVLEELREIEATPAEDMV